MTEMEKMLRGDPYRASDPEVQASQLATKAWLRRFSSASDLSLPECRRLLKERFAAVGDGSCVRPPFHCDYGFNISLGSEVFLNFNCVILDVVAVTIGDRTQIGPGVQLLTADHPRDPTQRRAGLEFGRPIHIGQNAWIGAGAIILPGVTVGDDAIIGAGSIVTRSVSAGTTVVGNPAHLR